jgi:nucleoid DNA-binding protein
MTKAVLVSQVAEQSDLTKKLTEAVLKSLEKTIHQALIDTRRDLVSGSRRRTLIPGGG